jgi:hypothetical protein
MFAHSRGISHAMFLNAINPCTYLVNILNNVLKATVESDGCYPLSCPV